MAPENRMSGIQKNSERGNSAIHNGTVLTGRMVRIFFEDLGKKEFIGETGLQRNLLDGQLCPDQQIFCPPDSPQRNVLLRRKAECLMKFRRKLRPGKRQEALQFLHTDLPMKIPVDVFKDLGKTASLNRLVFHLFQDTMPCSRVIC